MSCFFDQLSLGRIVAPTTGIQITNGPILGTAPAAAQFTNSSNNTSATGSANTQGPIQGFGVTSTSGDTTLIGAFNKSNATFTAPYNGKFTFVGWQQWLNGGTSASYSMNFTTNATYANWFYSQMYVAITPFNYTVVLTTGQTVQITGNSSSSWGSFNNSLAIYAKRTL